MKKSEAALIAEGVICDEPMQADAIIGEAAGLISPPHVCLRLYKLIHSRHANVQAIVETISTDPNLVARFLKTTNSLVGDSMPEISTIDHAARLLGTEDMYNLLLGMLAARADVSSGDHFFSADAYWQHSVFVGLCCKYLTIACNMPDAEMAFIAGLLHDIGLPVMYASRPKNCAAMKKRCKGDEALLAACEQEQFGFDHGEIGGALLKSWHLPEKFTTAIAHHHQPHDDPASAILYIAELIANAINLKQDPDSYIREFTQYDPWSLLQIKKDKLDLNKLVKTVNKAKTAVFSALYGH